MDGAEYGVIFFSLGTFVPDHHMPYDYFEKFIKAFAKLKQRVLWRTKAEYIAGLPDNVKTTNWAPQQDILGILAYILLVNFFLNMNLKQHLFVCTVFRQ